MGGCSGYNSYPEGGNDGNDGERRVIICNWTAMAVGRKITALRTQRGWSQEMLAERSGVDPVYIERIENWGRISIIYLNAIAVVLEIRLSELCSE